jgi:hypothetical protein
MGDLVGIDGGKKREDLVRLELDMVECGNCESAIFAWKVASSNPKQHVFSCCVCGYLFPVLEAEQSNVFAEFDEEGE